APPGRLVETELMPEDRHGLRCRALAEHRRGDVARQNFGGREDQHTDAEQRQQPEDDSNGNSSSHRAVPLGLPITTLENRTDEYGLRKPTSTTVLENRVRSRS